MDIVNEEVEEKMIAHINVEDDHNDNEKDNLTSPNDDDNIHVNILYLYLSY
jgi:hypothetical protein